MKFLTLLLTLKIILVALVVHYFLSGNPATTSSAAAPSAIPWWGIQSIDTMKYSRDVAREKLTDPTFDAVIEAQIQAIAKTGATHVAIATPYDEEFVPFLRRWVTTARKYGLLVWFRGNWSGWEKWFEYSPISASDHIRKTEEFILLHRELFQDGDLFSACPECENGRLGDPRNTGKLKEYREFIVTSYQTSREAFQKINKKVRANTYSMNGDVARLVMDPDTTAKLDGIVVVDHYVKDPQKLAADVRAFAARSKGQVMLGEFGAPIPDIHGNFSQAQQAEWLSQALNELGQIPELVGVNYWVNVGGSAQLWDSQMQPRQAVQVLTDFYQPPVAIGEIKNELGYSISQAEVSTQWHSVFTDKQGKFQLPYLVTEPRLKVRASGYEDGMASIVDGPLTITLTYEQPSWWIKLWKRLWS